MNRRVASFALFALTASALPVYGQFCPNIGGGNSFTVEVDIGVSPSEIGNLTVTRTCALAFVNAIWFCQDNGGCSDSDYECMNDAVSIATAICGSQQFDIYAQTVTRALSVADTEICMRGRITWEEYCEVQEQIFVCAAIYEIMSIGNTSVPVSATIAVRPPNIEAGAANKRTCTVSFVTLTCDDVPSLFCRTLCVFPNGTMADGLTLNEETGDYEAVANFPACDGDLTIELGTSQFTDGQVDVNQDGRFNESDIDSLTALLSSTDPDDLRWDFDGSGVIDQGDIDLLEHLIACGLSAGVFGDCDSDGDADCNDLECADGYVGYCAGDMEYRISLDFNLDGCVDASDKAEWIYLINPADYNANGTVDTADYFDFLNCFYMTGCPGADFNRDGSVNSTDFFDFLGAFFGTTC